MRENRDYLEMTFHSINCFADDGSLDVNELNQILAIALKDGIVDDNEKRVLTNIIGRLNESELEGELLSKVEEVKAEFLS